MKAIDVSGVDLVCVCVCVCFCACAHAALAANAMSDEGGHLLALGLLSNNTVRKLDLSSACCVHWIRNTLLCTSNVVTAGNNVGDLTAAAVLAAGGRQESPLARVRMSCAYRFSCT